MLGFQPTEEQELVVETVRQFAANELRPRARECEEAGKLAPEVLGQAHELGLVASALPEQYGGGGERSAVTGALVAEELAWGDLSTALAILSPSLLAFPLLDFGTDAQRRAWLPALAAERFQPGSLALLEPRFDADPFRPRARARREGDSLMLSGRKCLVPVLDGTEVLLVAAEEEGRGQLYLVPRDAPGLGLEREDNLGIRALPTFELALDGVRVPASARLGGEAGADLRALVNRGRVGLAAMAVGVARTAFELARDYAKERRTFGQPIATRQSIAFLLADMAIETDGARLLVWEAAWKLDRGEDATREAALAARHAARVALQAADGAVQVFGGYGYIREYLPELLLRNARGFATFEALTLL